VLLWDIKRGKCFHRLTKHKAPVLALAITPDARTVLSGGADDAVIVWRL
jgi:WD40 repeat protein